MKIAVCSDLHLEFGQIELKNTEGADVLVLSGDILCAEDLARHPGDRGPYAPIESHRYINSSVYRDFFDNVNYEFPNVVYVAGNHEFYHCKWKKTLDVLRETMENYTNIHFLENDTLKVDDVTFIGCTLWTDMNNGDPLTLHAVRDMMNDFRLIINDEAGYTKLRPAHVMGRHARSKQYIEKVVEGKHDEKFVVCTHHAPSFQSIPYYYINDTLMNGAYASKLEEFILDRPQIKLWTHGHTHNEWDYMIGDTRIFCNPRGYKGHEIRSQEFVLKFVDVI